MHQLDYLSNRTGVRKAVLLVLVQAALIGFTIYVLVRLPAKKNRTRLDYPSVDKELFEKWHETDLKADIAFLWGMAIVVVWVVFYYLVFPIPLTDTGEDITIIVIRGSLYFVGYIIPLLPAAILQNRASKLKRRAGID